MGAGASSQYRAGDANHRPPSFAEAVATKRRTTPNINVVVDGMNVALANVPDYEKDPSVRRQCALEGLRLCVEFLIEADVAFKIFAPRGWVDDHPETEPLQRSKLLFATPGGADDRFLLRHAEAHGSFVVSNDRFMDHARDRGYAQRWLDYRRVPFMFDPSFAPDPDAVARIRIAADGRAPAWAAGPGCEDMAESSPEMERHRPRSRPHSPERSPPSPVFSPHSPAFGSPGGRRSEDAFASPGGRRSEALERLAAINDATAARVEAAADIVLGPAGPAKMDDTTECLAVPRAAVGRVIGKRGATIKGIERDSGCRVRVVDGDDDGDDAEVRVSHPDEARRAAALDAVLAIVERDQYRPPPSRGNTADRGRRDEF